MSHDAREASATEDLVEQIAQFLHDEGGFADAWPGRTWPEHPDDTGQRGNGFVRLVPSDATAQFRDVARRLVTMLPATLSPDPVLLGEVREVLESLPDDIEIFRSLRAAGQSNRAKMLAVDSLLQPARAILAKLIKLTGEEV